MKDLLLTRCRSSAPCVARFCACMLLLSAGSVFATERFHVSTLKVVYPVASGDFVLGLDSDSSYCTSASAPNKYYHVVVSANGMTLEGSKSYLPPRSRHSLHVNR